LFEWFILESNGERLEKLRDILVTNNMRPKISGVYPIEQTGEVLQMSNS